MQSNTSDKSCTVSTTQDNSPYGRIADLVVMAEVARTQADLLLGMACSKP
jgi:hypothetical protein